MPRSELNIQSKQSSESGTARADDESAILEAMESLRDDNELLKLATDATGAGTFDYDPKTGRKYWSQRTRRHFGVNAERTPNHELFIQCLHPDDRQRVAKIVQDVLKPGSGGFYHTRYRTIGLDDGQLRHIAATGRVLFDRAGDAIRFLGTTVDVTRQQQMEDDFAEQKRSEKEHRLLNARFEMALKGAPVVLFCQDLELRYIWIHNPALGYEPHAVIGKRDVDLFERPEEARNLEEIKRSVIITGLSRRQEVNVSFKGETHYYDLLVDPLMDEGQIAGVRCAALDITAIKHAERLTRENEDRLQLGLAVAQIGLAEVDYRTGLNHLSAAAARLFGLGNSAVALPREAVHSTFHPDDRLELKSRIDQCLNPAGQGWFEMDHRVVWPDGQVRWLRVRKQVFFDGEGESRQPQKAMLAAMDITDLAKAKALAEASNHTKDRFLAVLSHELRTPLAPVLITAEHLATDPSLSAECRDLMEMVRRNVTLEVRLIDDLLDITRISSEKLKLQLTRVDAHQMVTQVLGMVREDTAARRLDIGFTPAAAMHHIQADKDRFQQIIWNLLNNAIKFTPSPGRINVTTINTTAGSLEISISDSGIGIDSDAMHKIFDAFEQGGEQITNRFGGLGLGLAITKALVELHGGTLRVASPGVGKGATFTFSIPNAVGPIESVHTAAAESVRPLRCSILLVEDHADTRKTMVRLLKAMGCEVQAAGSVAEALAMAAEINDINLVISDIGLPDGSGMELMKQLKQLLPVKAIALSGYGMEDDLLRSKACGFDAHLVKPVNLEALRLTIWDLVSAGKAQ